MKPLNILIVDDQPINLRLLRAELEAEGHTVFEATNGEEGLAVLDRQQIDVIISDILMPVMDGYRFCHEVRRSERHRNLPFIVYTSTYLSPSDEKLSLDLGADRYLRKPASVEELLRTMEEAVSGLRHQATAVLDSSETLKEYNDGLVTKLEKKNVELSKSEEQLRETERRFREMLDNLELISIMLDTEARVTYCNDYFLRLTGWEREEVIGTVWFDRFAVPGQTAELQQAFQSLVAGKEDIRHYTNEIVTRSGEKRLIQWNNSLLYSASGDVIGTASIAEDITDRRRLEQQLFRTQRLESLGTLASGIAHDLNNLLLPILMGVTLLKRFEPGEASMRTIENIERSVKRGSDLVKQVLLFGRGTETSREPVHIGTVISELEAIISSTFPKDITLEISIAGDLATVTGDATQLTQVLLNLCVNSRDAMPLGGQIAIWAANEVLSSKYTLLHGGSSEGPYVVLKVTDTGEGISTDIIDKIFDPFFTTKEVGKGTGLGLSTVQGIVTNHGGFVTVVSEPGEGSTFTVYIPARAAQTQTIPPVVNTEGPPRGKGELILLVDDEAAVVATTKQTLEAFGYKVLTAEDGAQAIGIFSHHRNEIALVLTDMAMPIIDGPALIAALNRMAPDVRIIATTGNLSRAYMTRIAKTGVTHILTKPYTADHLLRTIADALKG